MPVRRSACLLVCWMICHDFLKRQETPPTLVSEHLFKRKRLQYTKCQVTKITNTDLNFENNFKTDLRFQDELNTDLRFKNDLNTDLSFQNDLDTDLNFQNSLNTNLSF